MGKVVLLIVFPILFAFGWLAWKLFGRPLAVSRGWVELTAYDHAVAGWKAERSGRWADALAAYDRALGLDPGDADAAERRQDLLERHPELASERPGPDTLPESPLIQKVEGGPNGIALPAADIIIGAGFDLPLG